jgi:hypothetical protein
MVKADCGASLISRRSISSPIETTPDLDVSLYLGFTQRSSVASTEKASISEILEGNVWATYEVLGRLRLTERSARSTQRAGKPRTRGRGTGIVHPRKQGRACEMRVSATGLGMLQETCQHFIHGD